MRIYSVLLVLVLGLPTNVFSQVTFVAHTIVGGELRANAARSVYAADVDGDGDIDVLTICEGQDCLLK